MKNKLVTVLVLISFLFATTGYGMADMPPKSASGISKANVVVNTGSDGLTVEQRNIKDRLIIDNKIGSIKHLYIFSAYSGQCLIYSTVKGKVTSSGKRLSPTTVGTSNMVSGYDAFNVEIGGSRMATREVLQDDGSYGTSIEYLFWWDTKGIYHQHYVQGGQIVHISDQPMPVKSVTVNMELAKEDQN